jgi:hypothetical protein
MTPGVLACSVASCSGTNYIVFNYLVLKDGQWAVSTGGAVCQEQTANLRLYSLREKAFFGKFFTCALITAGGFCNKWECLLLHLLGQSF